MGKNTVEFTAVFETTSPEETNQLIDDIIDAIHDNVCPYDEERKITCCNCNGTGINPPEETTEETTQEDKYAPGQPCWECTNTTHPNYCIPCAREHHEFVTVHPHSTIEDYYRKKHHTEASLYKKLLTLWETEGSDAVETYLHEQYDILIDQDDQ